MKKLLRKLLFWALPELKILKKKDVDLSVLRRSRNRGIERRHIFVCGPYSINEARIGDYSYIAYNSNISNTTIGKFCSIGPNFLCGWGVHPLDGISTSPMFYSTSKQNGMTLSKVDKIEERKQIVIGNDVFIGANVTVLDGVTIGDGAVIGAGAVVSKDIPPYAVAVGCPIKIIKYRFDEEKIEALKRIKWWEFDEDRLKEVEQLFFDVDGFIEKQNQSSTNG